MSSTEKTVGYYTQKVQNSTPQVRVLELSREPILNHTKASILSSASAHTDLPPIFSPGTFSKNLRGAESALIICYSRSDFPRTKSHLQI